MCIFLSDSIHVVPENVSLQKQVDVIVKERKRIVVCNKTKSLLAAKKVHMNFNYFIREFLILIVANEIMKNAVMI